MKNYTVISQPENIKLEVVADSLEELFLASLEGMNRILNENYETFINKHALIQEILASSNDLNSLLLDFLSGVLTYSLKNNVIFYHIDSIGIEENDLKARLLGVEIERFNREVKGITYLENQITKNELGSFNTTIVFEV